MSEIYFYTESKDKIEFKFVIKEIFDISVLMVVFNINNEELLKISCKNDEKEYEKQITDNIIYFKFNIKEDFEFNIYYKNEKKVNIKREENDEFIVFLYEVRLFHRTI